MASISLVGVDVSKSVSLVEPLNSLPPILLANLPTLELAIFCPTLVFKALFKTLEPIALVPSRTLPPAHLIPFIASPPSALAPFMARGPSTDAIIPPNFFSKFRGFNFFSKFRGFNFFSKFRGIKSFKRSNKPFLAFLPAPAIECLRLSLLVATSSLILASNSF